MKYIQWLIIVGWALFFGKNSLNAQNLTQYEYWIDNDYAGRITTNFSGTNVIETHSFTAVPQGLHAVHYRAKDDNSAWSSVVTGMYLFAQTNLLAYEYWFDNNYANKVVVNLPVASTDSIFSLPPNILSGGNCGLFNSIHIRFKQSSTGWSSVFSYKGLPCTDNALVAYRTWFDADYANVNTIQLPAPIPTLQGNIILNTTGLVLGQTYQLRTQFKDNKNNWSSVITKSYIHTNVANEKPLEYATFTVYPNPSNGIFHLNLNDFQGEKITFGVMDIKGKTIIESTIENVSNASPVSFSLKDYPQGVYIIKLTTQKGISISRIVKE